jgi:murein L,D-transpeptidase YcbB/YkuD
MAMRWKRRAASLAMLLWAGAAGAQTAPAAAPANPGPAAAAAAPAAAAPATPSASAFPIPPDVGAAPPIEPPKIEMAKPKRQAVAPAPPRETALSEDPTPTLQADTYFATLKAAERYAEIAQAGGWLEVAAPLRPGARGEAVAILRRRLAAEGDLDPVAAADGPAAGVWDRDVTAAVKRFQARMGLRETGVVAGATLRAINVPADARARQLAASARRLAAITFAFEDRYVAVNIPAATVEAVEGGRVARRYVAIVGDVEHPSPEIAASISVINLNPTWTVPVSIIKKEIIPKMQRDPGYLARAKIRILDAAGATIDPARVNWSTQNAVNYTLRQDSGAGNSLGAIRIGMPNKLAVYMHDTPTKRLFGADYRFLSHGCVRVQGVYDLAQWLLRGTPDASGGVWDKAALLAKVKDGAREDVRLAKPVPVIWVYLTGWADGEGRVSFRDDVYGIDASEDQTANAAPPLELAAPAAAAPFAAGR